MSEFEEWLDGLTLNFFMNEKSEAKKITPFIQTYIQYITTKTGTGH